MTAINFDPWRRQPDEVTASPDDEFAERMDAEAQYAREVAFETHRLRVREAAREALAASKRPEAPPFDAGLLRDLLNRPAAPPHRIDGLIPSAAGTLIVAMRKTGKTTLMLNLARCLLTGEDFLGNFGTRRVDGRVGLLNFEVSGDQIARWADEHGVDRDRFFIVNLRGRRNPLGDPEDRERLAHHLRDHEVESLIVDPFSNAFDGTSQNDSGEVSSWLSRLDTFARSDAGVVDVVLAAHAGWGGERTRGASALEDWADSIITLTRDPDDDTQRYLRAEGRDVLMEEDLLRFDADTRQLTMTGGGSRRTNRKVRQLEALMPLVVDLLTENPGMSGNQLDTELAKSDQPHSKGDGKRVANLLVKQGRAEDKEGPRRARLFYLTSPTSLNLPKGNSLTSPTPLYRRGKSEGESEALDFPERTDEP